MCQRAFLSVFYLINIVSNRIKKKQPPKGGLNRSKCAKFCPCGTRVAHKLVFGTRPYQYAVIFIKTTICSDYSTLLILYMVYLRISCAISCAITTELDRISQTIKVHPLVLLQYSIIIKLVFVCFQIHLKNGNILFLCYFYNALLRTLLHICP